VAFVLTISTSNGQREEKELPLGLFSEERKGGRPRNRNEKGPKERIILTTKKGSPLLTRPPCLIQNEGQEGINLAICHLMLEREEKKAQ